MAEPSLSLIKNHAAFIWSVADLLRGDYKQSEYGKVILPLTVIRRLDCVLEPTKPQVLAVYQKYGDRPDILQAAAGGLPFYNTSKLLTLERVLDDATNIADQLRSYLARFSEAARDVLDKFEFEAQIARLDRANLLYLVVSKFCAPDVDLHPERVSNLEMGYLYEELVRKFAELSNETAGEHFTPREVIRLMVDLLLTDEAELHKPGILKTLLDPACGTGGMLSTAEQRLRELNPDAKLKVYGQELNAETYAVCRSDMMIKGQGGEIVYGNSFSEDGFEGQRFDYLLANPPFGVEWKKVAGPIKREHERDGFAGRFGAGLPRINDGSFLFLQHMISKMKRPGQGGARLAIVFNGSPLFSGAAGSGESEIRRWIIENDWLEAVVALPDQLFYNTGISTYFWIVTNRKSQERRGKVQLIDAREYFTKMRKSLGEKRKEISPQQISEVVRLHGEFTHGDKVKIFPNESFGFLRITVERPLRLRWEVSDETRAAFNANPKIVKLSDEVRAALRVGLDHWGDEVLTDAKLARKRIVELLVGAGQRGKSLQDAVMSTLAVRDPNAPPVTDDKGNIEPDPELRDYENVPLPPVPVTFEANVTARLSTVEYRSAVDDYMEAEVLPYVPDAWVDHTKTRIGYEIPLTRHFYKYIPPRPLAEIDAEIKQLEAQIQSLLNEVTE
ncbi:MAG TPA: class I SAM-dependent DNA methyltransferase [Pseudonocardiaceae bacterium]|jgi:type I restriction enzyme M protein|nr:class I SAM-dependent DNA methyltransferase [Pseudonocardiaceae bacterium]